MTSGSVERVLAVGAHPDDCELLCGGTLTRYAERGASIFICAVACGDKGARFGTSQDLAEERRHEAAAAAAVIAATPLCLEMPDGEVFPHAELRLKLIETIRHARPDLILTHSPGDYHADHQATADLVAAASWFAASPGHLTASAPLAEPVPVFYMDTLAGLAFQPTEYVDVTGVIETKEAMLRCHASQLGQAAQHGDPDLIGLMRDLARLRGHQCGVCYAEGFRPCLKWKRVRPYRLLPQ